MRETQILRGLHKARANCSTGAVPMSPQNQTAFDNLQNTPVGDPTAAPAQKPKSLSGNGGVTGASMLGSYQPMALPSSLQLSRGVASLKGPGTTTSDSIPVNLSKGEAVLPAKTVQKVGVHNIARLIHQTNGKPPVGLRAGAKASGGGVPLTDDIVGPRRPQTVNVDAGAYTQAARDAAAKRAAPPMGGTTVAVPIDATGAAPKPAPKTLWQQTKQWGSNMADAARGRATPGVTPTAAAPAQPSALKPVLGSLVAGAVGSGAGYAAAQAAKTIGDPSGTAAQVNPTVTPSVMQIPTDGGRENSAPAPQPYNYFQDNETGRNIGNTLNAVSMIPGAAPVARSALGMGTGAISKTLKLAERPLVVGAVQGAAQGVRAADAESSALTAPGTPGALSNQAATAQRTGLALASRQQLPMQQDPRLLNADTSRPELGRSRDFSNELNGARGPLPSDLRDGVIHKTVDAQGRVTYSGRNVSGDDAQFVDGMGKTLKARGGLSVAPGMSQELIDKTLTNADGIRWTARDNAAMAANLRDGQDPYRGTSAAPAVDIMNTPMTKAKRASMVALQAAQMQQKTAAEQNAIQREHNQLTAQSNMARLGLDRARIAYDMRKDAVKDINDSATNSPFAVVPDKDGVPKVSEAAANDLRQFRAANAGRLTTPDGKPIDMTQLKMSNPTEYDRVNTAQDSAFGLGQVFNKYAKDKTFGAQTGWGVPKISGMREMGAGDWFKGAGLTDAMLARFKPGYYSQGVEIDLGGRKQIVPIGEILNGPNGGQLRETLNQWRIANKLPPLGNAVTGE